MLFGIVYTLCAGLYLSCAFVLLAKFHHGRIEVRPLVISFGIFAGLHAFHVLEEILQTQQMVLVEKDFVFFLLMEILSLVAAGLLLFGLFQVGRSLDREA